MLLKKIPGIWLLDASGAIRIDHNDILYCHHLNDITKIVYLNGRYLKVQVPLKRLEEKLCKKKFYRCHRNYLVNLDHAKDYCPKGSDKITLVRRGSVPVARRRKNELLVMMERLLPCRSGSNTDRLS